MGQNLVFDLAMKRDAREGALESGHLCHPRSSIAIWMTLWRCEVSFRVLGKIIFVYLGINHSSVSKHCAGYLHYDGIE